MANSPGRRWQIDEQLVDKYSIVVHLGGSGRNVSQGWESQKRLYGRGNVFRIKGVSLKKIKRWKEGDQARVYSMLRAQRPERKRNGKKERRDCEGEVRQSEWTRCGGCD